MFQEKLLDDGRVERLADATLTVLERVGIYCQNDELLKALGDYGAIIDMDACTARFPRRLITDFVETLRCEAGEQPAAWRDPLKAPPLPALETQVAQFYYDDATGERRSGGREDFITLTKFGEALHPEQGVGHALILQDVPPLVEPMEAALLLAEYSARPARPSPGTSARWTISSRWAKSWASTTGTPGALCASRTRCVSIRT